MEIPKISYLLTFVFLMVCVLLICFVFYIGLIGEKEAKNESNLKHLQELSVSIPMHS
jgi:hypothetical protein